MQKKKKRGQVKRRLMTGVFCIGLLAADLVSAVPVWAQEAVVAEHSQESGESEIDETKDSVKENQGGSVQDPDENSSGDEASNSDGGLKEDPDEEKTGDEEPDFGKENDGDDPEESGQKNGGKEEQEPDEGVETESPNGEEASETEEEPDSVSENDVEAQGEVRALTASGDSIASGTYKDITWVIDANGKLTVEGTGDFAEPFFQEKTDARAPWGQDWNTKSKIKSAEIKVSGMTDASYMFDECVNLEKVDLNGFDAGTVTNMCGMFRACYRLENIDFGQNFDTGNVTDMSWMFSFCRRLESINFIQNFNMGNVTDMSNMFCQCSKLESINFVQNINMENVTNMSNMFSDCSFKYANISGFITSKELNMTEMFSSCGRLESIVFGQKFNTGNVTDMSGMFAWCTDLKDVDVGGIDTSKVVDMSRLFARCYSLGDLNLSGWDTANVTDMSSLFDNCGFDRITLGGSFTTKNVTNMCYMFALDSETLGEDRWNLKGLDLTWLNLNSVDNMDGIFYGCNVKGLDFGRLDTEVTDTLGGFFSGCDMTGVDFSSLKTDTITDMSNMFSNCSGTIDLCTLDTRNVTDMSHMFSSSLIEDDKIKLTSLDLSGLNTENVKDMSYMFTGQTKLTNLDISVLDTVNVENMSFMFWDCKSLSDIDMSGLDTSRVTNMRKMFDGCTSLSEVKLGNLGTGDKYFVMYWDFWLGRFFSPAERMFAGCSNMKNLDLSKLNFEYLSEIREMLDGCDNLTTIYTPYNVTVDSSLPDGDWYMADGTKLEDGCLPKNIPYSVLIQKGSKPTVSAAHMEVFKKKTAYNCGETINTDDLTVTYYGADGNVRKLTAKQGDADGYTTNATDINMNEPGEKKLIVTYQAGDKSLMAELTLTVTYGLTADNTTITLSEDSYIYDGKAKTPKPTVAYSGSGQTAVQLTEGTDYIVSYKNNINAYEQFGTGTGASGSTPTVIITGTGDYSGTVTKTFSIRKAQAPAAEEKTVLASRCTQADPNRTTDLSGCFASCGKKNGYEVVSVEDPKQIFTKTPVTTDIQNGVLTYGTKVAQENDSASIRIKVSFANYEDAELTVKVLMSEEGVVYTVNFDLMGHGSNFAKRGIKEGRLLMLSADELTPAAEGYLFTGWYRDKSFAKGKEWNFDTDTVQSDLTLYACWLTAAAEDGNGLKLCVQEIPDLTYTGSTQKPAVTVYDSDGKTLLKVGKDYTVKYVNNTNAVKIGTDGKPEQGGGTAKVENPGKANETITDVIKEEPFSKDLPYVVIIGKGNYTETIYRNFHILPAGIAAQASGAEGITDNTPLAAGFTLKYTDQFEAKAGKTAKIISSFKYKKALKEGSDYEISVLQKDTNGTGTPVTLAQGKLPLNAGNYEMIITGKGNYTGTLRRSLYVASKKNLMKNASVTYAKTIQAKGAEDLKKGIEQPNVTVKISGKPVDVANYTIDYVGTNHAVGTATMTITGRNGYVGSKSVTFKITGMSFNAKTVEVKAYDANHPDETDWKASMPYTGRAVTQNRVTLTTKVIKNNQTAQMLTYGEHYTITYKNNVKKGTAAMTFTAKPESGFSGSFKKNFKITSQELSADMFVEKLSDGNWGTGKRVLTILGEDKKKHNVTVKWDEDAVHSAGGAALAFKLKNVEGMEMKWGTDYTVSYKNNKAATKGNTNSAVIEGSKQPVMTIKGKGNYAGTLTVQFQIIPESIDSTQLTVTAAQVQKKNGMNLKDFKLKVMDGKTALKAGKDYTIDESGCTPEIIQAYADSLGSQDTAGSGVPAVPKVIIKGMGNYGMQGESASDITKEISLSDYIYATKLTAKNLKVEVIGDKTYTGRNVEPTVKVSYYKDNNAAKQDGVGVELTNETDYKVTYGNKNISAGKKKGSIAITGAGIYGGSVTVKFDIEKKRIY